MNTSAVVKKKTVYERLFPILQSRAVSMTIAILFALLFCSVLLLLVKANPLEAFASIFRGAFFNFNMTASVFHAWIPLLLATCGLMFTFTAGLWNIGMEGQITMGAIFCYGVIRLFLPVPTPPAVPTPAWIVWILAVCAGIVGGVLWSVLVGTLRIFFNVNEIFGGLGLNFIAEAIMLYLVFGPWSPEATASGTTDMLPAVYKLPKLLNTDLSLWALIPALIGVVITFFVIKNTYFGLKLKAVGRNKKAAFILGIPTTKYMILAFLLCGIFAGLIGSFQVIGARYVLRNNISAGYGYSGLLIGMLSSFHPLIGAGIAFVFAVLNKGGNSLNTDLHLDSNMAGVIQGSLLMFVLMMEGVRKIVIKKVKGA